MSEKKSENIWSVIAGGIVTTIVVVISVIIGLLTVLMSSARVIYLLVVFTYEIVQKPTRTTLESSDVYRMYFGLDAYHDLQLIVERTRTKFEEDCNVLMQEVEESSIVVLIPSLIVGKVIIAVSEAVLLFLFQTISLSSVFVVWLLGHAFSFWLKRFEYTLNRVEFDYILCPAHGCHEHISVPVFHCPNPNCNKVHRDLNPGVRGILHSQCVCGQKIPISRFSGKWKLRYECPHCTEPLCHIPRVHHSVVMVTGSIPSDDRWHFHFSTDSSSKVETRILPIAPTGTIDWIQYEFTIPRLHFITNLEYERYYFMKDVQELVVVFHGLDKHEDLDALHRLLCLLETHDLWKRSRLVSMNAVFIMAKSIWSEGSALTYYASKNFDNVLLQQYQGRNTLEDSLSHLNNQSFLRSNPTFHKIQIVLREVLWVLWYLSALVSIVVWMYVKLFGTGVNT